jgi:hypothetical protein
MDDRAGLHLVGDPAARPRREFPAGTYPEVRELLDAWGEGAIGGWLRLLAPGSDAFERAQRQLRENANAWRRGAWAFNGISTMIWNALRVLGVDPAGGALCVHTHGRAYYLTPGGVDLFVGETFADVCNNLLFADDRISRILLRPYRAYVRSHRNERSSVLDALEILIEAGVATEAETKRAQSLFDRMQKL